MRQPRSLEYSLGALLGGALIGCGSASGAGASADAGGIPAPRTDAGTSGGVGPEEADASGLDGTDTLGESGGPDTGAPSESGAPDGSPAPGSSTAWVMGYYAVLGRAGERRLLSALGHRLGRAHAHRHRLLSSRRQRRLGVRLVRRGHGGADHRGGARAREEGDRLDRRRRLGAEFRGVHAGEPLDVRGQPREPRHDGLRRARHRLGGGQPHGRRRIRRSKRRSSARSGRRAPASS